jgi:hypothetical protein
MTQPVSLLSEFSHCGKSRSGLSFMLFYLRRRHRRGVGGLLSDGESYPDYPSLSIMIVKLLLLASSYSDLHFGVFAINRIVTEV